MKWMTSTLSSQDDLFEDEGRADQGRPDKGQSDVQYADLELLRRDSLTNGSTEGLPNDDEEGEEDVFPMEVNPLYGRGGVIVSSSGVTAEELESDTRLVYINVPTSTGSSLSSSTGATSPVCPGSGGRSATLPAISESTDQIFPGVVRGHSETSSSTAEYANIGSPRRARLGVGAGFRPNSNGAERRATISFSMSREQPPPLNFAPTAKLQPLSPTNGKIPPVSRLQPQPSSVVPLPLSSLLLVNGMTSLVASKVNQKITYVQLDLQTTPTSGRCHPLNSSSGPGGFTGSPGGGSDSPRVLCRASSVAAAAAASEGYATIDFQRTLALNSKCADEGVRKTRHNSHIEMVALH